MAGVGPRNTGVWARTKTGFSEALRCHPWPGTALLEGSPLVLPEGVLPKQQSKKVLIGDWLTQGMVLLLLLLLFYFASIKKEVISYTLTHGCTNTWPMKAHKECGP